MEHSAGKAPRMKQRIALLGSTGSIGVQTLDIVRENSELFEITTLTAHRNWEALARQAEEFAPDSVVICDARWPTAPSRSTRVPTRSGR